MTKSLDKSEEKKQKEVNSILSFRLQFLDSINTKQLKRIN